MNDPKTSSAVSSEEIDISRSTGPASDTVGTAVSWTTTFGTGQFDPVHRTLITPRGRIHLSPLESDLLFALVVYHRSPCPMRRLAAEVWGNQAVAKTTACRQLLRSLRLKLKQSETGVVLVHVPEVGYRLVSAVNSPIGESAAGVLSPPLRAGVSGS